MTHYDQSTGTLTLHNYMDFVDLTDYATLSYELNCDGQVVSAGSVPYGDDGNYYIYADEVWQDGPRGQAVARTSAGRSVSVSFPLNYNTDSSNLSRKFLVAVKRGGQMVQVSDEHYITNPEAIAAYSAARNDHGIKGILPDVTRISDGQLQDLGIKQIVYNMDLG